MRGSRVRAEGSRVRHVTVEGFEHEGDGDDDDEVLVFAVCPTRSRRGRCSRCDRKCRGYNQGGGRRRWRSLDLGTTRRRLVTPQIMLSFPFALIPLLLITPPPGHHGTFTNHRITTAAAGLIVGMIIAMSICLLQSTFAG